MPITQKPVDNDITLIHSLQGKENAATPSCRWIV